MKTFEHVTRIEGHGKLKVQEDTGGFRVQFEVDESPRLFELFLRGREWSEIPVIASRVCGICSVSHNLVSIKAVEDAFDVTVSEQTLLLRKLLHSAEVLQSHILHLYFLVLPDFLGAKDVLELAPRHPAEVQIAFKLKGLANHICEVVGGRMTHPISSVVGGFTKVPSFGQLKKIRNDLAGARLGADETVRLFKKLTMPGLKVNQQFLALKNGGRYSFYDGDNIGSSKGMERSPSAYHEIIKEAWVAYSSAKHSKVGEEPFMVGALARLKLNARFLSHGALKAAEALSYTSDLENPFWNNTAQVVETVFLIDEMLDCVDNLLDTDLKEEPIRVTPREGEGVGAIEAPRGTLYHKYRFDKTGQCLDADIITPTAQNVAHIQKSLETYLPAIASKPQAELTASLETLVRAYDPCLSCSTH